MVVGWECLRLMNSAFPSDCEFFMCGERGILLRGVRLGISSHSRMYPWSWSWVKPLKLIFRDSSDGTYGDTGSNS
jgi:hypothetical protein